MVEAWAAGLAACNSSRRWSCMGHTSRPRSAMSRPCFIGSRKIMSVYDFEAKAIDGTSRKLDTYKGKALLIVNVASKCGFTPQYTGLEALHRKLHERGFNVL